ncbi:MAG: macB 37 [Acidobacteria bacterium]|nr:macB 37 [Acidobacteriota bacterium]
MILKALVLRPIFRESLRTALTILGIAVGVAVVVAIALSNQSALRAFQESVDAVAGRANYMIVSDVGLDENVLLKLQPFWEKGVRFAPVIDVEGMAEPWQQPIRLLAVDMLSDLHFRDYRYASVVTSDEKSAATYLAILRDDSVVLPATFAHEHGLKLGSPLTLNIKGIRRTMIVRGLLEASGPATAFNGAIAIADIAAAQSTFGFEGHLTRIDLIVPDDSVLEAIRKVLPPSARMERPARRNERVEKMLRAFRVNLFALAGVALLVGMFLVYNTVLISILRRRRDVGILKTLGVSPPQIFAAFVGEGLLFGAIGSAIGIALGNAVAFGILKLIGRTINSLYVTSAPEAIVLTPGVVFTGIAVGTLLSLVSAIQPSLEAARVPPGALIRAGLQQRLAHGGMLAAGAAGCFAVAALVSRLPPMHGIAVAGYVAVLFVVAGFSLLAPAVVRGTAALTRPLLRRTFGIVGELAAASLPASLRRTSIASAALSLATGMMIAVALMVGSFRETVNVWVDQTISSDLWLRPAKGLTSAPAAVFPASIVDDLKRVEFIAAVDPARGNDLVYGDSIINVASGDFGVAARFGHLPMIAPAHASQAIRAALANRGVMASESFALKFNKGVGDSVELPTANGMRRFPITGIYRDYSNDRGVVVMDRALYIDAFRDDTINTVILFLRRGVDREWARRELERRFGPKYHAFAITNGSIRKEVMTIFDQTFLITYALLGVAIVVAVLGIVNTLAALILERTRELALLRISGMSTAELRTMIVVESSLLGLASIVVGLVMGYALSWILIYVINKQSFGWTIEFHTPLRLIAGSLAVTFVASVLAGLLPSRLANRIHLASAIKAE